MTRATYTEISHRLVDTTAKPEAEYSMDDLLEHSSFEEIKDEDEDPDSIMSSERNHNILDGSMTLVPDDPTTLDWGVWTNSKTDENADFDVDPVLSAEFENVHTSTGITFVFEGDAYPEQIEIIWYNDSTVVASETFAPDAMTYFCDLTVESYNKVVMTFSGMSLPDRHLKIAEIDYGEIKIWSKNGIISANILEEINLTSTELTINTLEFSVHDDNEEFNMLNPDGVYVALQEKQKLTVKEYLNGAAIKMGKFYLDTWENTSTTVAAFTAYDAMGLFDTIQYITSPMWSDEPAENVFEHIFAAAGWTDYVIEDAIKTETVRGYIPAGSVRNALHHICLSLRCSCIPNRKGSVEIKRLPSEADAIEIEKSRKLGSPKITQNALVNSVAVTGYDFTVSTESTQLYSAELEAGSYEITFSNPATNLSASGATIVDSGINYAKISVTSSGTVAITGNKYDSQSSIYTYEADGVTAANRAQKTVKDVYLVNGSNAEALAQFLYEDYQRRIVQKFSMALEDEIAGDNVDVDTMLNARKIGVITSLDIDLTGGFVADMEVRG